MNSVATPDEDADVQLDLALSIGGTFRNLPDKSTPSGSSFPLSFTDGDEEEEEENSGVTDVKNRTQIRRREPKRKRDEEYEQNPPFKREKKLLQGVGSECNVDRNDYQNKPAVQIPYPYSSLQYVPFLNGYAFPYVVPYWAASAAAVVGHGGERTIHHPVACRSFRPFETNRSGSSQLEQSESKYRKTGSGGSSPVCSSSVISDNYQSSSSHEGGGSSHTKSNSCNSSSDQHQMLCRPKPKPNPNPNDSMNHVKPKPCNENRTKKEPIMASNKEEVVEPSSKSVFNSPKSSSISMKNMKMENGKPPKPQIQSGNVPNLQQMPCVTTTGVGPNGKTITGFLYRYSNLEVSILCVCHGESFSPAEFVKHAGGGDISNPLRHITVLPTKME